MRAWEPEPSAQTGEGQQGPNLTVLNLACGAAVLPLDPHRFATLLQEARLIDNPNPVFIAKHLDHKTL